MPHPSSMLDPAHEAQVRFQRQLHETRHLLLEAADHLLDVEFGVRANDRQRTDRALQTAASVTTAAQHSLDGLARTLRDAPASKT